MTTNPLEPEAGAEVSLRVRRASKTFNGITVLDDVTLELHPGEVTALIGQNGSGKSTFIKILSGFHQPDPGAEISMAGSDVTGSLGEGAGSTGMAFVHQDLALVPSMTILENLRIAQFTTGFGRRIRWRHEESEVARILARVGLTVSPHTLVARLSVTDRALVAIARGLAEIGLAESGHAGLLVLDEPTAYLPQSGVERLFSVIDTLTAQGTSILFVSHRLDEVMEHCARVLVLRGGRLVADTQTVGRTERDLVEMMLGQPPEGIYPDLREDTGQLVLEVKGLHGGKVAGIDLTGRAGEIIGLVGLPGEGYDDIPYLLSGAAPVQAGTATVGEHELDLTRLQPGEAIRRGIALLPADRKASSGAITLGVGENLTLPTLSRLTSRGRLRHRRERDLAARELQRFTVTPARFDATLSTLSGGNQQKVMLAKWAITEPKVFLLHEPTQGVDVGAKRDVFAHLDSLSRAGALLLISSVEFEDLANLCTRVHVVRRGTIVRTLEQSELSAHALAVAVHER